MNYRDEENELSSCNYRVLLYSDNYVSNLFLMTM